MMKKHYIYNILPVLALMLVFAMPASAAVMEDYCVVPPYVKSDIPPNIMMIYDNSEENGHQAYWEGTDDPLFVAAAGGGDDVGILTYTPGIEAPGLFRQELWYSYNVNAFYPDPDGAFSGNFLNWATTSIYDVISAIIVGGKSTARVGEEVKFLQGYSGDEPWPVKMLVYVDANGKNNACEIFVNPDGSSDDKFDMRDSYAYKLQQGAACGLIDDTPSRPADDDPNNWVPIVKSPQYEQEIEQQYASGKFVPNADVLAKIDSTIGRAEFSKRLASVIDSYDKSAKTVDIGGERRGGVRGKSFSLMNDMLDYVSESADAAAVTIVYPTKQRPVFAAAEVYLPYATWGTSGGIDPGDENWTITGELPTGLTLDPYTGVINGTVNSLDEIGLHTFELTVARISAPLQDYSRTVSIEVIGRDLEITAPQDNGYIHDISAGKVYRGFQSKALGGYVPGYVWSLEEPSTGYLAGESPLPGDITIDPDTGFINGSSKFIRNSLKYAFDVVLNDEYNTIRVRVNLIARAADQVITTTPINGLLPTAYIGKPYAPYKFSALGGSGQFYWQASEKGYRLPSGLYSNLDGYQDPMSVDAEGKPYVYDFEWQRVKATYAPWQLTDGIIKGTVWPAIYNPPGIYPIIIKATDRVTGEDTWSNTIYSPWQPYYLPVRYPPEYYVNIAWPPTGGDYAYDVVKWYVYSLNFGKALATGGTPPYKWSMRPNDPAIDMDIIIDSATGELIGNFTAPASGINYPGLVNGLVIGTVSYRISVVDSNNFTDYIDVNIRQQPNNTSAIVIGRPTSDGIGHEDAEGWEGQPFAYGPLLQKGWAHATCTVDNVPPEMTFDPYNCVLTGTPTYKGDYLVKFTATAIHALDDTKIDIVSRTVKIAILGGPRIHGINDYKELPKPLRGVEYEYQFNVVFGHPDYIWSLEDVPDALLWPGRIKGLPPGFTLNSATGKISGITNIKGQYQFKVVVTDQRGDSHSRTLFFDSTGNKPIIYNLVNFDSLPDGKLGNRYSGFSAVGRYGIPHTYTFSIINQPPGISINPETGLITGIPAGEAALYDDIMICISDASGDYTCVNSLQMNITTDLTVRDKTFVVEICAGDYDKNCSNGGAEKQGLLMTYWDPDNDPPIVKARFGMVNFKADASTLLQFCVPYDNQTNFLTGVQNAQPSDYTTSLVNGEYRAVASFMNATESAGSDDDDDCKVFDGDETPCRQNFILMLTSGNGADNPPNPEDGVPQMFEDTHPDLVPTECKGLISNLAKNACFGYMRADFRPDVKGTQKISTYVVNAMGGLETQAILQETANASGGLYYYAANPSALRKQLEQAFEDIIKRATSGTAASVLASGEGSGANIIQAIYYPKKRFVDSQEVMAKEISWIGKLSGFWYYSDPYYSDSDIREDTEVTDPHTLNLYEDFIIQSFYNTISEKVEANRAKDLDGSGGYDPGEEVDLIDFEQVTPLWEAGQMLWARDLDTNPRKIWVNVEDAPDVLTPFTATEVASGSSTSTKLLNYMQAGNVNTGVAIANFVHGYEVYGMRDRTVKLDRDGDGATLDDGEEVARVWKLGDVLNSSPTVSSAGVRNNRYYEDYDDSTYTSYLDSDAYSVRGMVYAGGNDGMLHAFKLGYLEQNAGSEIKATLYNSPNHISDPTEEPLGEEMWAFIPKNALPYLKYTLMPDYCHIYMVDQTVTIVDVSICVTSNDVDNPNIDPAATCENFAAGGKSGDSWRTVLIGGMRTGGACKSANFTCTMDTNGDGSVDDNDCVKTPINEPGLLDIGLSSYFALDITNEDEPSFMWEFSHADMGYSTSGPTVIRFNGPDGDKHTLGRWYVVFGSGPTGPIDKVGKQFVGASDQPLRFFILDLRTGKSVPEMDGDYYIETGIDNAYITSMGKVSNDYDEDYQTEVIYAGYISKCDGTAVVTGEACPVQTWRNGGVVRILTGEEYDPTLWEVAPVIENIGPVTGAISRGMDSFSDVWIFAGTGRYSYQRVEPWRVDITNAVADDLDGRRTIFGFKDPCATGLGDTPYTESDLTCTDTVDISTLIDVTDLPDNMNSDYGWYLNLDAPMMDDGKYFGAERVITDSRVSMTGIVYFTSFKPFADECSIGGETYLWAFKFDTGGAPKNLRGVAIMQVSTGNIEKIDLETAFTEAGGRKTKGKPGVSSQDPAKFADQSPGNPRMLHILERNY